MAPLSRPIMMDNSMTRNVLFYDEARFNSRAVSTVLAVADCRTIIAKSEKDFVDILTAGKQPIHLLIYPIECHKLVQKVSDGNIRAPQILLSQSKVKDLHNYFSRQHSTNILAKNNNGALNPRELVTTVRKIFNSDIFGVKHYVNYGTESEIYHIRDSEQRSEYIDAVKDFCNKYHVRTSVTQAVELFCEELLMNAIYDAPRDENGQELYGQKSRRDRVLLRPREAARMEFACDGEKMVISVSDPFGAITWDVVRRYLSRCFTGERKVSNLNEEGGGAGLGLYFCFNAANSFVINVNPDNRSEFIGVFDLLAPPKERNRLYSSLHFFSTNMDSPIEIPSEELNAS